MASNRLSHFYDMRGASMTVDTGCSTTLTALHQACVSLWTRESDMAVVGGANVMLNPDNFEIMSSLGLLGPTGRSFAFDNRAEGYGRGEGSATVLLKRLDDALRNGDPVRAVIRATGVNQDGKTESLTTPSQGAQEDLMRMCYAKAGLDPGDTDYFEAHGTGTPAGDPIEARAISSVFKPQRPTGQPVRLGSVKTNVGHTETASGLASIIKAALVLEKGRILPNANFETPNKNIDLEALHLKVPREVESWPQEARFRRASVNNFGYGGANAHVILESYKSYSKAISHNYNSATNGTANGAVNGITNGHSTQTLVDDTARIIILSAKDERACQAMVSNLGEYLSAKTTDDPVEAAALFASLAYTLGQRRSLFPWVAITSALNVGDLSKQLTTPRMRPARRAEGGAPRLGFVFTGQGAQWFAMGRELIAAYPVFRDTLLEAEGYLRDLGATWSLVEELTRDELTSRVSDVELSTPLCVTLQIALVRLLRSWGVVPAAITSHSSGEIAAACAIDAISLHATMATVFSRGELASGMARLVDGPAKGGMMAMALGAGEAEEYLKRVTAGRVVVACFNSPVSTTISGDVPGLVELEAMLKTDGIFVRRLKVEAAWHSHHVQAIAKPYRQFLERYMAPLTGDIEDVVFTSPTTGERIKSRAAIGQPQHWVDSLVNPVKFIEAFRNMCFEDDGASVVDAVIEIGPHGALSSPIQNIISTLPEFAADEKDTPLSYHTTLIRRKNAVATMHALVADLVRKGYPVNMEAVNFPLGRNNAHVLTDLPSYPWNHSVRHWSESRANKALRERRDAPHDLLGTTTPDYNTLNPSWRHILRVSDQPWVRDHTIQSSIVYPGAGYICMAIEGICAQHQKQHDGQQAIQGYRLRNIKIQQALVVPETAEGVEVQLALRPCNPRDISATDWQDFQVCSVTPENVWTVHCTGQIQVAGQPYQAVATTVPVSSTLTTDYRLHIAPKDIYTFLRATGINHGPIFQNLKEIRAREKESVSIFTIADTAACMPYKKQHAHIIHPTTLDTVFQAAYTALDGAGARTQQAARIPSSIGHIWVAQAITSTAGHDLRALTTLNHANNQSFEANITVTNTHGDDATPVLTVEGLLCKSIGSTQSAADDGSEREKFIKPVWGPDISFLKPDALRAELHRSSDADEIEAMVNMRYLITYYITEAIEQLNTQVDRLAPHMTEYYTWMTQTLLRVTHNKGGPNGLDSSSSYFADDINALEAKVRSTGAYGHIVTLLGSRLASILRGDVVPLKLLRVDGLLEKYCKEGSDVTRARKHVAALVSHIVHKNPRARILEIGAGAGAITAAVLETVDVDDIKIASYEYTDISPDFFVAAKERFKAWENFVTYRKLDIEQDPTRQGFKESSYDLVIASRVLSCTASIDSTMTNVRKLLKPNGAGRLILVEPTQDQINVHFTLRLLPSLYSNDNEERKLNLSLSAETWDRVLRGAGFRGVEFEVHNCDNKELYSLSTIMSTTAPDPVKPTASIVIVTRTETSELFDEWVRELQTSISHIMGSEVRLERLASVQGDSEETYVFVGELEGPILSQIDEGQFEAIRAICTTSKGVLWVTRGGAMDGTNPHLSLSIGFLRSLRNEYGGKRLVSLDLDPDSLLQDTVSASTIIEVFGRTFNDAASCAGYNDTIDFELAERQRVVYIPRYRKDTVLNKTLFPDAGDMPSPEMKPFEQPGRPLRLFVGTPGLLDTLVWDDDPDAGDELDADVVEVAPHAFGLNFRDIMVAMGQLQSSLMGFECAGHVVRVGSAVREFKPGDRVAMLLRGYYGNLARVHWTSVVHIPEDMSFEVAASLPVSYCTAYLSVYTHAQLQKSDTILIHAASGAFGQAALVLARHIGAEIYVTVGTSAKRKFIEKHYGIPPKRIFSSRDPSFATDILTATNGRGVDVVLNSLAGSLLQESFNCLAPFGRFIEIGKRDLELDSRLAMGAFKRAVSFTAIDLLAFGEQRGPENHAIFKEVMRLAHSEVVVPVEPITVLPVSKIGRTYRLMQAGKHMGKIVIDMKPEALVPVLPQKKVVKLRADGSYLIVGGLGGIGRSVCGWLVAHGARNLIIISRRGDAKSSSTALVTQLGNAGCRVEIFSCDVAVESQVASTIKTCTEVLGMPPIRGVIQAAMVLQVCEQSRSN